MTEGNKLTVGARWWSFDFHTHTPASNDFDDPDITTRQWLLAYMNQKIHCLAVTDHNNGNWIHKLQTTYQELKKESPLGFRELYIFPGVELNVNGNIHLLAIFDPEKKKEDIDKLLGAVGLSGVEEEREAVTSKTLSDVAREIEKAGGIAIPAHVIQPRGLFNEMKGATLKDALKLKQIFAMEVTQENPLLPQLYTDNKTNWTQVFGSDSHSIKPGSPGRKKEENEENEENNRISFTWIKMEKPDIEGLKLALLNGQPFSVLPGGTPGIEPLKNPALYIKEIQVSQARYCGNKEPLTVQFNPSLNTIIGGRGTGKSSIVEFLRIALRREKELTGRLKENFDDFINLPKKRGDTGVIRENTTIKLFLEKDNQEFLLQWNYQANLHPVQIKTNHEWQPTHRDILNSFPIRIYSQKQIYEMAESPDSLLKIIDDQLPANYRAINEEIENQTNIYLTLQAKTREITTNLGKENIIKGELEDIKHKLNQLESSGQASILKQYQNKQREKKALENHLQDLRKLKESFQNIEQSFFPWELSHDLSSEYSSPGSAIHDTLDNTIQKTKDIHNQVKNSIQKIEDIITKWERLLTPDSPWKKGYDSILNQYNTLSSSPGIENTSPSQYTQHVLQRQHLEQKLTLITHIKNEKSSLETQANIHLEKIVQLRKELFLKRKNFLDIVLKDNHFIRITPIQFGDKNNLESQFRKIINREDNTFQSDILSEDHKTGLLADLYKETSETVINRLKEKIRSIIRGEAIKDLSKKFSDALQKLPPESIDRLSCWFPGDSLEVEFSTGISDSKFKSIQQGSPGQRTAALLAFLLSIGEEPMILDQPEDDLDNHLIYDLIVNQLREKKNKRQFIIVTHNPNIVVNAFADLVIALDFKKGEFGITQQSSIQNEDLRDEVCRVMEGGREGLQQRYLRVMPEGS